MNRRDIKNIFLLWMGVMMLLVGGPVIAGCQTSDTAEVDPDTSASAATTRADRSPTVEADPTTTVTMTPEDSTIRLTVWSVEPVSPRAAGEAGRFIGEELQAFERANPNIEVDLILKKASGKGGVLDFLRTARDAAPAVLPDVAVMLSTDLDQANSDNLLQSLDGRLSRSIVQDLLPAARKMGTVNDKLVGVPLAMEMEHVAYKTGVFTAPPLLWTDIFSANTRYLFPARGINGLVNDVTVSQYWSAGGEFFDDQGEPTIDERALRTVLDTYQRALENGVIDAQILESATMEELWPGYLAGEAGLAQVSVQLYLTNRDSFNSTLFAPVPVQQEQDIPIGVTRGWTFALITDDPARQDASLSLIEWFLSTENNVNWNSLNNSIPIRDSAYQQLAGDDPYWAFLIEQLNAAQPQPGFAGYDRLGRIIQQAVVQVISGEASPEEATTTAMDALTQ